MLISSWNVNSVRARILNITEYLKKFSPDILMIQEIKTEDKNYPYEEIKSLNYNSYVFGQKAYNGVAILSKEKISDLKNDIINDKKKQSRIIKSTRLINSVLENASLSRTPEDIIRISFKLTTSIHLATLARTQTHIFHIKKNLFFLF